MDHADEEYKDAWRRHRLGEYKYRGPSYFNAPEGEGLIEKLVATTGLAAGLGWLVGLGAIYKRPFRNRNLGEMMFICAKNVVPAVAVSATFTIATYYATRYRQKDDIYNYGVGGAVTGTAIGLVTNYKTWVRSTILLAVGGCMLKGMMIEHNNNKPIVRERLSPIMREKLDYSLVAERKGNWTAKPITE